MTTIELNAMRCELAREILNLESSEMLQKLQIYFKQLMKEHSSEGYVLTEPSTMTVAEDRGRRRSALSHQGGDIGRGGRSF